MNLSRLDFVLKIFLCLVCTPADAALAAENEFSSIAVFSVADSGDKDLSGLALCNGELYVISDKVDSTLFEIQFAQHSASLVERLTLPPIPAREMKYTGLAGDLYTAQKYLNNDPLDWEDIQCNANGLYLLSERKNGILQIRGDSAEWLPIDWYEAMRKAGYLTTYNAYGEGLAIVDDHRTLVALERQPRGLLELTTSATGEWQMKVHAITNDQKLNFRKDSPDIAALALHNGYLFTLERNASAICRRDLQQFIADSCFSYRAVEDDQRYRFKNQEFGLGEGLAIDTENIYLIFDTNGAARETDRDDKRSLLLKISLPEIWR